MNKTYSLRARTAGLTLIEALVALVIISVGVLAIARLQGDLVANTSTSKARAEAVQLAESEIERLRSFSTYEDFAAAVDEYDGDWTEMGQNAEYTLSIDLNKTEVGSVIRTIEPEITVEWQDRRDESQSVTLSTFVVWDDPRISFAATESEEGNGGGSLVDRPTGAGRMGGDEVLDVDDPDVEKVDRGEDEGLVEDGTDILMADDGTVQLVRGEGDEAEVLMTMEGSGSCQVTPDCIPQRFSTIRGRVYFDNDHDLGTGNNDVDPNETRVVSSDAAFCTRFVLDEDDEVLETFGPDDTIEEHHLGEQDDARYFDYQCYFAEGWYGNIGIVRFDGIANQDQVCVGSPAHDPNPDLWASREARLSSIRRYRGFYESGDRVRVAGIGVDPSLSIEERYPPVDLLAHDFLLSPLGNNADNEDCQTAWSERAPSADDRSSPDGNPGRNYCLLDALDLDPNLGYQCIGDDAEVEETRTTIVSGAITETRQGGDHPELESLTMDGGEITCETEDLGGNVPGDIGYVCEIERSAGQEAASTWEGTMEVNLGEGFVCDAFEHSDNLGDGSIELEGNVFDFEDISEFGEVTLDFEIAGDGVDCEGVDN
ncbi:prepilin-type N-terminal cleavage/methylation domain-containing protein [Thioalkalivibrio sp. ALE21]|uniref:type IV pilus modification PilV family protein n=1 Tax=Thioalkalivibrio sp. ALE21 TaxID=1158175 RepID=UPI0014443DC1|nr:prepilin-type N-terminal cleavage/methylation domain-containing protein [Thioalkalivibrio sp. ALE21]